ncbi:MAG TPA: bifunctional DNA-formamidopyrimidine glycosylase/DNA-(apurinic or apyrimidinic site) lyase [Candidatus Acidoferrales bacterium]|nr:bifunctional DNA-formamidopyrimidine glycosylase/DNA-(apurinic or apyrimidinic site) lyase [Candidatus Acidoferrales bacterium]
MPELPEVETVVQGLRRVLPGRRVVALRLGKTDFIENPAELEARLPGSRISTVRRHGKFIVLQMEPAARAADSFLFLVHLGMTGRLVTAAPDAPAPPHTHAFFSLDNGRELRYTDIRRFGSMRILEEKNREATLGKLGLDPIEATEVQFRSALRGRRARIKAALLDQRVFRGLGNIYTDESLWRARIHPMRRAANLSDADLRRLRRAVRHVLAAAIRLGGSSVSDYVNAEGNPGEFQLRHRAYQRKGKPCHRCGTAIERILVAGRSSYFCPRCQRAPRGDRSGQ